MPKLTRKIKSNTQYRYFGDFTRGRSVYKLRLSIATEDFTTQNITIIMNFFDDETYQLDVYQIKHVKSEYKNQNKRLYQGGQFTIYLKKNCNFHRLQALCTDITAQCIANNIKAGVCLQSDVAINSYMQLTQDSIHTRHKGIDGKISVKRVYLSHDSERRRQLLNALKNTDIYKTLISPPEALTPTQEYSDLDDKSDNAQSNKQPVAQRNPSNLQSSTDIQKSKANEIVSTSRNKRKGDDSDDPAQLKKRLRH